MSDAESVQIVDGIEEIRWGTSATPSMLECIVEEACQELASIVVWSWPQIRSPSSLEALGCKGSLTTRNDSSATGTSGFGSKTETVIAPSVEWTPCGWVPDCADDDSDGYAYVASTFTSAATAKIWTKGDGG